MQENSPHDAGGSPPNGVAFAPHFAWVASLAVALLAAILAGPRVAGLLASTALVVVPAAVLAVALVTPLALLTAKTDARGRRAALVTLATLVVLPLHVVVTGWMALAGDQGWAVRLLAGDAPSRGWLAGYAGAIALHALAATPLAALLAGAALRAVPRCREEQALLDTTAAGVLWRVTLREAAPALAAVGVVVAALAAAEIAVTDLLRVRTFAEEVYTQAAAGQLTGPGAWRLAGGVVVLAVALGAAVAGLLGRLTRDTGGRDAQPWRAPLGRARRPATLVLALLVGVLALVPLGSLVATAGSFNEPTESGVRRVWRVEKLASSVAAAPWQHRRELRVSLTVGAAVATSATLAGAAIAWATRARRTAHRVAIGAVALLLATPGPVVGLVVIRVLNQPLDSPLAWLGGLYGTWFAPWLAQTVRLTPITTLLLWPAARRVPESLVDAARVDGAGPVTRLFTIAGPLMAPALAAAWVVALALSVGELAATVLVTPPGTPPLSVRLLSLLHYGVEDRVAAICLVLVAGYAAAAWLAIGLLRRTGRLG